MAIKRNRNIVFRETLKDISVLRFDRALSGDYLALVKRPKKLTKFTEKQLKKALKVWQGLYEEYIERTGASEDLQLYLIKGQIEATKLKRKICTALLGCLRMGRPAKTEEAYMEELTQWGYFMDKTKPIIEEIEKTERQVATLENDLAILNLELKELRGDTDIKKEELNLNRLKVKLKISANVDVDLATTSMDEWLILWEELEKQAKKLEKQRAKIKGYE